MVVRQEKMDVRQMGRGGGNAAPMLRFRSGVAIRMSRQAWLTAPAARIA